MTMTGFYKDSAQKLSSISIGQRRWVDVYWKVRKRELMMEMSEQFTLTRLFVVE